MIDPEEEFVFDEDLPESIRDALRSQFGSVVGVPSAIDEAILADARRQLTIARPGIARRRWKVLSIAGLSSSLAAAAVVLMFRAGVPNPTLDAQQPLSAAQLRDGDVDGNGRVDILDAFAVARQLQQGTAIAAVDADGDGRTTQADVDLLAQRAVML